MSTLGGEDIESGMVVHTRVPVSPEQSTDGGGAPPVEQSAAPADDACASDTVAHTRVTTNLGVQGRQLVRPSQSRESVPLQGPGLSSVATGPRCEEPLSREGRKGIGGTEHDPLAPTWRGATPSSNQTSTKATESELTPSPSLHIGGVDIESDVVVHTRVPVSSEQSTGGAGIPSAGRLAAAAADTRALSTALDATARARVPVSTEHTRVAYVRSPDGDDPAQDAPSASTWIQGDLITSSIPGTHPPVIPTVVAASVAQPENPRIVPTWIQGDLTTSSIPGIAPPVSVERPEVSVHANASEGVATEAPVDPLLATSACSSQALVDPLLATSTRSAAAPSSLVASCDVGRRAIS